MNKETFKKELEKLGIVLNEKQEEQLQNYYKILTKENKTTNLTTILKEEEVYLKHFYDSLTITKVIDLNKKTKICDIGTGAGFTGIVLKIVFPKIELTLVDSVTKKTQFLKQLVKELKIENVEIINERIENFSKINKEKFDILTSRAVAKQNVLQEIGINSLKLNGYYIIMKGKDEDISQKALKELNVKIIEKKEFNLPIENSNRTIIKIQKIKETDKKYPKEFKKKKRLT